jgi:hypothetical protein
MDPSALLVLHQSATTSESCRRRNLLLSELLRRPFMSRHILDVTFVMQDRARRPSDLSVNHRCSDIPLPLVSHLVLSLFSFGANWSLSCCQDPSPSNP